MIKQPDAIIRTLQELRREANFETTDFGSGAFSQDWVTTDDGSKLTTDSICKERTRLYRDSWVLPIIDDLLKWAHGDISAQHVASNCNV